MTLIHGNKFNCIMQNNQGKTRDMHKISEINEKKNAWHMLLWAQKKPKQLVPLKERATKLSSDKNILHTPII